MLFQHLQPIRLHHSVVDLPDVPSISSTLRGTVTSNAVVIGYENVVVNVGSIGVSSNNHVTPRGHFLRKSKPRRMGTFHVTRLIWIKFIRAERLNDVDGLIATLRRGCYALPNFHRPRHRIRATRANDRERACANFASLHSLTRPPHGVDSGSDSTLGALHFTYRHHQPPSRCIRPTHRRHRESCATQAPHHQTSP